MVRAGWIRWFQAPLATGWQALLCGLFAVWIPTVIRLRLNGVVTGCEFTPYLPFVLGCAILMRSWQAAAVAVASVAIMGGVLGGSPALDAPCFVTSAAMFIASSAVMIGVVMLVRRVIAAVIERDADELASGLAFTLDKGEVWASWYGHSRPLLLGSQRKVSERMREFLAQAEAEKRSAEE
jgi:hypothetical protein